MKSRGIIKFSFTGEYEILDNGEGLKDAMEFFTEVADKIREQASLNGTVTFPSTTMEI